MDRSNPSFDDIVRGPASVNGDDARRVPMRSDGGASGRFVVVAFVTAAGFAAAAAVVSLILSIRDDEAALGVGFSVLLQAAALLLLIGAGVRVAFVDGIRWPFADLVTVVALISIGLVAWAYQALAAGSAYIP